MTILTKKQQELISSHKIALSDIFDATGQLWAETQQEMYASEKLFAFNTKPCERCHNTVKTRSNHCIECNRAAPAFQMRNHKNAHVYIAGSRMKQQLKVGSSEDLERRISHINREKYGGSSDWVLLASCYSEKAGNIERFIQMKLKEFNINGSYKKAGRTQQCYELYRCDFSEALRWLRVMANKKDRLHGFKAEMANKIYKFQR